MRAKCYVIRQCQFYRILYYVRLFHSFQLVHVYKTMIIAFSFVDDGRWTILESNNKKSRKKYQNEDQHQTNFNSLVEFDGSY